MDAYFVSSFLHLNLNGDGVEDGNQCLNPWGDRQWKSKASMSSFAKKEAQCVCKNKPMFEC